MDQYYFGRNYTYYSTYNANNTISTYKKDFFANLKWKRERERKRKREKKIKREKEIKDKERNRGTERDRERWYKERDRQWEREGIKLQIWRGSICKH